MVDKLNTEKLGLCKLDDYEDRERIAISAGKKALAKNPLLLNRANKKSKGFFFELMENNFVHPDYYAVHCVDGVGTKLFLSAWSNNYSLAATDALAMNANDMATAICAFPDTINLYLAVQSKVEEEYMGDIMAGMVKAIEMIIIPNAPFNPNIGKIETASLEEVVSLGSQGKGWDIGVTLTGYIKKDKVPNLNPKSGNIIVGVSSTGLHSNGYTSARHILLNSDVECRNEWKNQYTGRFNLNDRPEILSGKTILQALQEPTAMYLLEASLIGQRLDDRDIYAINITGNGLENFNRVGSQVSFEITDPLQPLPIHQLLIDEAYWKPSEAYLKQNMGMGFAYIVKDLAMAEEVVNIINQQDRNKAKIVGEVRGCDKSEAEIKTIMHKPYQGPALEYKGYHG